MAKIAIIGCGYVADLYMRSLRLYRDIEVVGAFDIDSGRLAAFCAHWGVPAMKSAQAAHRAAPVILNLTNPAAHAGVTRAALDAGCHVWSEKPLAMDMGDAAALADQARTSGLHLCSAPSSVLGRAAQTLARAVRTGVAGQPRLVYAELDDGFVPQAPYRAWISESGAPWPFEDEFRTGCTVEHAGYYLTWLVAMFGPVRRVVAASAEAVPEKLAGGPYPDVSVATLFFDDVTARLTCSIVAPHDHSIRVIGDKGVLRVARAWDNAAPVRFHRRFTLRRRLVDVPLGRRLPAPRAPHPMAGRMGAAAMNFALGPVEMIGAIAEGREPRLNAAFSLHVNEVTLAIQNAGRTGFAGDMTTACAPPAPMPWAS